MDMSFTSPSPGRLYLQQLLKTATNGNVTVDYALLTNRMALHCKVCDTTLTAAELVNGSAETLDYSIQEFIKLHSHAGGHPGWNSIGPHLHHFTPTGTKGEWICTQCGAVQSVAPKAVTADFKEIPKVSPEALSAYEKLKAMADKVTALQQQDADKGPQYQLGQHQESPGKYYTFQKFPLMISPWTGGPGYLTGGFPVPALPVAPPPAPAPKKKDKPLKISTGRKFR
jgi:hypothetical protein